MEQPGSFYVPSGQYNLKNVIISTIVGMALATGIGALYALITFINPLIYLNFLVLMGAVFLLALFAQLIKTASKSRNTVVNIIIGVLICYTAWAAHWSLYGSSERHTHTSFLNALINPNEVLKIISYRCDNTSMSVGRLGSSGIPFDGGMLLLFYFIEFIVFMAPVYFLAKVDYYCEHCQQYYTEKKGYITDTTGFYIQREAAGEEHHYRFLPEFSYIKKPVAVSGAETDVIAVTLNYCTKCAENSIVDVSSFIAKIDSSDKYKTELVKESKMTTGMYIDKATGKALEWRLF
ncbi:hypothetical protein [Chitinophaga tropicalis]|uniref:Uncharacterized protein n=1 Tax=Chitinophaga tropicalis TaxID=2683588 RepID=A0A7K1U835_9BACT|nr:hypothetical protein [Chitinophaga tropicalis]MVT10537.1 hypothetical protein [Chitinophaga tropicalis]